MPRSQLALLLFAGSVLLCAALVAANLRGDGKTEALATSVAAEMQPMLANSETTPPPESQGRLLGRVERDGELVEVREAAPDEEPAFGEPLDAIEDDAEEPFSADPLAEQQPPRQMN